MSADPLDPHGDESGGEGSDTGDFEFATDPLNPAGDEQSDDDGDEKMEFFEFWRFVGGLILKKVPSLPTLNMQATADVDATEHLTSLRAQVFYTFVAVFGTLGFVFVLGLRYAGLIDTLIYFFLFASAFMFLPTVIGLFGNVTPGSGTIGKLHVIIGQFAFGRGILVQREDRWEWCPARNDAVYIDGEWRDIDGGLTNWSILGWRPFGILRYKDDETLSGARADVKASRDRRSRGYPTADGGMDAVERAGYHEVPATDRPLADESGIDGTWLLDLKRLFSRGIKKIGDIELIETAEEVTMRDEAKSSLTSGWESVIGTIVGLIIGLATGWVMLGGV